MARGHARRRVHGIDMVSAAGAQASTRATLGLPEDARGVLPSQSLERAVERGWIDAGAYRIPPSSVQPASLDLRLGEVAYRIRCSFLPDTGPSR